MNTPGEIINEFIFGLAPFLRICYAHTHECIIGKMRERGKVIVGSLDTLFQKYIGTQNY